MTGRRPWLEGTLVAAPVLPGIVTVGVLYGASAVDAGMAPWTVVSTSLLVATGTAQFIALDLLDRHTAWWLVVLVGLAINLRFAVYAIHLGGRAADWPTWRRLAYFGLVTDEGYALTMSRHAAGRQPGFMGWSAALMVLIWSAWLVGSALGALAGAAAPTGFGLEMAVPLTLLSVLVLMTTSSRHLGVALVAGAVGLALHDAPFGVGLLAGMAAGVAVGMAGGNGGNREQSRPAPADQPRGELS